MPTERMNGIKGTDGWEDIGMESQSTNIASRKTFGDVSSDKKHGRKREGTVSHFFSIEYTKFNENKITRGFG